MLEFSFVRKKVLEGDVTSPFMINITSLDKAMCKNLNYEICVCALLATNL